MTINWPAIRLCDGDVDDFPVIYFAEVIPLLSRPRYLWFLGALPEAERQRKMEAARTG